MVTKIFLPVSYGARFAAEGLSVLLICPARPAIYSIWHLLPIREQHFPLEEMHSGGF